MFVTKVIIANIIAFIKTKTLGPVLSVTNTPFKNDSPYGTVSARVSRGQYVLVLGGTGSVLDGNY